MELKHLERETPNGAQLNLDALYQIAPSCFTEAKGEDGVVRRVINWDKLRLLLGDNAVEDAPEVYDFTWVGKRAALREAAAPINKTLRPCPEESVDWDTTQNLYIEGDNLEVLKLLQNSYMGKVKMIYIDPPYNTGNDFVYHDDFHRTQREEDEAAGVINEEGERMVKNMESNGKFHSDWCSMIYARLMIARSLLSEDGFIFISIDDNEIENLRKICDEVFGSHNFKSQSIIINNRGGRDYGGIALQHDYILIYAKSDLSILNLINEKDKEFQYYDEKGGFNLMELRNRNVKFNNQNRPNLCYPFYVNPQKKDKNGLMEISLEPAPGFVEVYPAKSNGIQTVWRWGKEEKARKNLNIEIFGKANQKGGYMIVQKYRKTSKMQRSVWDEKEFVNERGTEAVKQLFNNKSYFDYPKSLFTIKRVIELGADEDCIILDFFSGSSTTAHAVMQLNSEDNGTRKYIMVQLPEPATEQAQDEGYNNLCDVAKERIRRAGKKIKADNPLTTQNLDTGFRVFKCDSSNYKDVAFAPKDYNQQQLEFFVENIKEDRNDLDLLFDCMLRWGVTLDLPMTSTTVDDCVIHNVNDGDLVGCFTGVVSEAVIDAIAEMQPVRVVFRDSSFTDAASKMNLFELFKQKCEWSDEEVRNNVRVI
ncbi:MAG: site-specific DNA-methyltransferase [Prevotella sp.]|nr:site-specific DNA-methyltransferase [Prevotella sp.]